MAARNPVSNILIGEIVTILQGMDTVNDYNYTQDSARVYDWLDVVLDIDAEVTHLNVQDVRSSQERLDSEIPYSNILELHVSIYRTGDGARAVIRKTKQDVLKALVEDFASSENISLIDYRGDEPQYDREKKLMGSSEMIFDVYYKTNKGQI